MIWGWWKMDNSGDVPTTHELISESDSLPKGGADFDGRTTQIAAVDERANVWFPWKLSSEDTSIEKASKYKILGNKMFNVGAGEAGLDGTGNRDVVMKFYFKINRTVEFEKTTSGSATTAVWTHTDWQPFILMYIVNGS